MRISEFSVENQRNIRLAACGKTPRVMVITGPNGCGKSTLLQNLRTAPGAGKILYMGPHRASRRQNVKGRFLAQSKINMQQILAGAKLPSFEGITVSDRARSAWDIDDATSFLKYGLCQIEMDRRTVIADRYDRLGEVEKGSLPDIWQPLRTMCENLLPHLKFAGIDSANRDQIKCLWHVHSLGIDVDIDDLSSGEKILSNFFFPLIENQVQSIMEKAKAEEGAEDDVVVEQICALIDEPELHLHPVLQGKVLDYMRTKAVSEDIQFIIATHSPTIVEHANSDELYLLRPSELVAEGENQLIRMATDDERLELMREVFGSTSNITAMRKILVVEGRKENSLSRRAADARIYSFFSPEFNQITILPAGGKIEGKKLASSLTELLGDISPDLRAVALLDRDLEEDDPNDASLFYFPVSMVENLLVDPAIIWTAVRTIRHKMHLHSIDDISKALDEILDGMEADEIDRRVKAEVGTHIFRAKDPVSELVKQVEEFSDKLKAEITGENFTSMIDKAKGKVEKLKESFQRREHFHGKNILKEFYRRHLQGTGTSKEIFIYECADAAKERGVVQKFVERLFVQIGVRDEVGDGG